MSFGPIKFCYQFFSKINTYSIYYDCSLFILCIFQYYVVFNQYRPWVQKHPLGKPPKKTLGGFDLF